MKLDMGCGPHWRSAPSGWEHADRENHGQPWVMDLTAPVYPWGPETFDVVAVHHVLHMLCPTEVRDALVVLRHITAPGGVIRIGERSVWAGLQAHAEGGAWLLDLIADRDEPTLDGKLLRWLTWHGTVRSLWSPASLARALLDAGWSDVSHPPHGTDVWVTGSSELDTRPWESFYLEALR